MHEVKGGCLCGSVRYESADQPALIAACHCTHCQKQSGGAFSVNLVMPLAGVKLTGPTLATFNDVGGSGLSVKRHFCSSCGSPIFTELDAMPGVAAVKAGTLDYPAWAQPQVNLWCQSALPWVPMVEGTAQFDQNPPA